MSKKKHTYTFSLCPIESIHTSNGRVYTDEEMKKMVEEYNYFGKLHGNDYLGLGEIYNYRKEFTINLDNVSHKIKKLEFSGNEVYGEFETVVSPAYERTNVVFVINDDEIKTIDIELEPIRDFEI